eukprot:PRCOL_00002778-RA
MHSNHGALHARSAAPAAPATSATPATCAAPAASATVGEGSEASVVRCKEALRSAIARAGSRASASAGARGAVAEAINNLAAAADAAGADGTGAESIVDTLTRDGGRWRLVFTTAPDVLFLLGLESLPAPPGARVRVGNIDQVFVKDDAAPGAGAVYNEASFALPPLLESATLRVRTDFSAAPSGRRLTLRFLEAAITDLVPAPVLDAVLAPPLIPRMGSLGAIAAVYEKELTVPLLGAQDAGGALYPFLGGRLGGKGGKSSSDSGGSTDDSGAGSSSGRGAAQPGPGYLLLYADSDTFVGRQTDGAAGEFVFERVPQTEAATDSEG